MTRRQLLNLLFFGLALPLSLPLLGGFRRRDLGDVSISGNLSKKQSLEHEGRSRSYQVYVPNPRPQEPCAAVLLLHGHGGSIDQLMGLSGRAAPHRLWMTIADRENLILIIPEGLVSPDGHQGWNDARNIATNPASNDVDFLNRLVDAVAEAYPVDLNRVYAAGLSNGGHMALRLAAESSDKFAAVAAIAAANPDPIFAQKPRSPISVLLMNGTDDRFVPYEGGNMIRDRGQVQSTEDSIQYWVCLLYTSPSPRDLSTSRMPSSA